MTTPNLIAIHYARSADIKSDPQRWIAAAREAASDMRSTLTQAIRSGDRLMAPPALRRLGTIEANILIVVETANGDHKVIMSIVGELAKVHSEYSQVFRRFGMGPIDRSWWK